METQDETVFAAMIKRFGNIENGSRAPLRKLSQHTKWRHIAATFLYLLSFQNLGETTLTEMKVFISSNASALLTDWRNNFFLWIRLTNQQAADDK